MNLLERLKQYSVVVADTGDIDAIRQFAPEDATTNPSIILSSVKSGNYETILKSIVDGVRLQKLSPEASVSSISDQLIVAMGIEILKYIPGRVSTEVDARLSYDTQGSLEKARHLVALYEQAGVSRARILIKLAATWEGIKAAEILEREGIHCNLTLIFGFAQARTCAEAGVYLISPFVGRILDWYRQKHPELEYLPEEEPGVQSVKRIFHYFREMGYPTRVMGASFRNTGEILALAGCDRLTINPTLLYQLHTSEGSLQPALDTHAVIPSKAGLAVEPLSEAQFRQQMLDDVMASEMLASGISGFEADQLKLEQLITARLAA